MKSLFLSCVVAAQATAATLPYSEIPDQNNLKILTPALANREIAKIRLANGLDAYIVSDPDADVSAAALAVGVGSWSDPKQYPGMAHFLEHMLFKGTKEFPDPEAFPQYIHDHGGSTNAYTSLDRTVYMFSVNNDSLPGALERFSQFFIDPLFKTSEVEKELHSVDQEHAKNIQSDSRRKWMIFKETGNQNHPNRAFATGNAQTLGNIPREALIDWYSTYYTASQMHLAVYSNLPMNELKDLVVKDFSAVKDHKVNRVPYAPLSSSLQQGHMIYIKPIKDVKVLSLDWELPKSVATDLDTKSAEVIGYVLQHGAANSLIETLKKEMLAEHLVANAGNYATENAFLHIEITLTNQGVKEVDTVIERCFQMIHLLQQKGIPEYLFKEMQTMSTLSYEYQSRQDAFDYVSSISSGLIDESLSTYPQKTLVPIKYDPKTIQNILKSLTAQNCIYILMADPSLTGVTPDKKEKWNGGEYAIKPVPEATLKQWNAAPLYPEMQLPPINPYLPSQLHLVVSPSKEKKDPVPVVIVNDTFGKSYLWSDDRFSTPEIYYTIGIKSPLIDGTARSSVLLDLYMKTFYQQTSTLLLTAGAAGLNAGIEYQQMKLLLTVLGYSQKAPEFLHNLLVQMKTISCSEEEFELYKDSLLSLYENQAKAQPYQQAAEIVSAAIYNDSHLFSEKAEILKSLNYQDLSLFSKKLFSKCYIEGLYSGNLLKSDALNLVLDVKNTLNFKEYPTEEQMYRKVCPLPQDKGPFSISENIQSLGNATLLVIEEGSFSFEKKAAQLVLATVMSDNFYDTLRSKQQTGYIATSWARDVSWELLQFFLVQSSSHQPEDLLYRFELFLEGYIKDFSAQISNERFEEVRKNNITSLSQLPPNLVEMGGYLYNLGFERKGDFSFVQKLIAALNNLSYEQLRETANLFLSRKNKNRLAVLVEGFLPSDSFSYHETTLEELSPCSSSKK